VSVTIAAQFDAIDVLAAELAGLAAELAGEAQLCRSTAVSLGTAVSGGAGEDAGAAGSGWAAALEVVDQRTGALAATLSAAVDSYRAADAALADRVLARRHTPAAR
jgi:Tfp pilus assembly protein FimT